jgi:NADH:ubiquinone oxidoreductase subunit 5 (subunit L)/multisubunit Na+/H+ antiporter MnhA subunit
MSAAAEPLFHAIDPHFHKLEIQPELLLSTGTVIRLGAAWAFFLYRRPEKPAAAAAGPVRTILERKYFMDDLYELAVKGAGHRIAALCHAFDTVVVNGLFVNGTASNVRRIGRAFSKLQSGQLHDYLFIAAAVLVAVLAYFAKTGGL